MELIATKLTPQGGFIEIHKGVWEYEVYFENGIYAGQKVVRIHAWNTNQNRYYRVGERSKDYVRLLAAALFPGAL